MDMINKTMKGEVGDHNLQLQEFCDMEQLYKLLGNWSKSCGMATVIVDRDGNQLSEDFGMTKFCKTVQSCEKGLACCMETWKSDVVGIYECPFGFFDFSIPIILPDGQLLGKVLAGQALSVNQKKEDILKRTSKIGIDDEKIGNTLAGINRKTDVEMKSAYDLLEEMLRFFVANSYSIWQKNNELKKAPESKDRVLSQITQIMYSYNLTIDIATGNYSLIKGTGMERTVEVYKKHSNQAELVPFHNRIIHPSYLKRFRELVDFECAKNDSAENGYRGTFEYPIIYPGDDEFEWHEINVFVDTEEDGTRIANILGRDITEAHNAQVKNEKELRAAADKNRILSELTKMLYSYNLTLNLRTGKYSMIIGTGMTKFMEIFRSTDDYETAYNRKLAYLAPENVSQFAALASLDTLRARTNSNGFIGNLEYGAFTDYGEEWHEINVFISTDEDGEPVANILGRDITDAHKRHEKRENLQKAAMARDQLLSGITKMLYSYNITINLESWKYSLITGTGMNSTLEIMQRNDDYVLLCAKLAKNILPEYLDKVRGLVGIQALKIKAKSSGYIGSLSFKNVINGQDEWHEVNLFIGTNEDGTPVANILGRDVTEAHDKADTKAQLEIANASNAAKSAFLFNMSHDIRTPMNAIIGFTELLDKHLDDKELARSYINKIKSSNEFLLSLINNVLEMARIESGKTTFDESDWNAKVFNDTLFALFDTQMAEKGIEFTRTIDVEHTEVLCDATKLREVFLNILSNALKYTPAGGKVVMRLKEIPSDRPGYAMYRTEIEDTGIGMSEKFLPHIFDEFTRERSSTDSRINGTGLGMAIVKKLVDFMDGTITVESKIGKGTKFTVTLPHRIAVRNSKNQPEDNNIKIDTELFKGKRILLAEDNDFNAEIAKSILEESGFMVEHAGDGVVCVEMLEKSETGYYDLVLMDIQMPNMDGYKATQTIRLFKDRQKANIPIIAMTANAFEEDRKNAYDSGMNGHIAKPINLDELLTSLTEILKK